MRTRFLVSILFSALMGCAADEQPARSTLSSSEPERPGAHCAEGGIAVHSGTDTNGNGALDANEIETTSYVCGSHQTLVREDAIAEGSTCSEGGMTVSTGHDVNDNGTLDDAEVESTDSVCYADLIHGDVRTGDYESTAAKAKLAHVRVVTGNVVIDSSAALPRLETVGGNLDVQVETPVELPALHELAGSLHGPDSGVLYGTNGSSIGNTSGTRTIRLVTPALQHVGGAVSMYSSLEGGVFDAPALTTVGAWLEVSGKMATIDLSHLSSVDGDVGVHTDASDLALPALVRVTGDVTVGGMSTLALPALESAASFHLASGHVTTLSLPALRAAPELMIGDDDALVSVQLPAITNVRQLILHKLPQLATLEMPQVTTVDDLRVYDMSWTDLSALSAVRPLQLFAVFGNQQLTSLHGIDLPGTLTNVYVTQNPVLTDMAALAPLTSVSRDLKITRNAALTSLAGLDNVATVGGLLDIEDNAALASLAGAEHLTRIGGDLTIAKNGNLASLAGLAGLTNVARAIKITDNAALPSSELTAFMARLGR